MADDDAPDPDEATDEATDAPTDVATASDSAPDDDTASAESQTETPTEEPEEDEEPVFSTPRLEAIRLPIPGDAPAGIDMKYEDDFQALKAQVDELGAATGEVDFGTIVDLSTQILSAKSKDLTVASYLVLGLSRTDGFQGIAEGVAAVRAVTEGFWEDAFPPLRRMRGRQAALQYVAERASAWIKDNKAEPEDREALERIEAEGSALQAFVMETMGEDAPAFSGLLREAREALRRLPKPKPPEPEPEPEPEAPAEAEAPASEEGAPPSAPRPAPRPTAPAPAAPTADVIDNPAKALSVVMKASAFLRGENPHDPVAFALQRAVRWDSLAEPPPNGVIPAPPSQSLEGLAIMTAASNHPLVVKEIEGLFPQPPFHFVLDLQRIAATSLRALGPTASGALAVVENATATFVRRIPALPTLTFADGTPFADPITLAWLEDIAITDGDGGGSDADDPTQIAIREAREAAAEGDVPGAVAALVAGAGAPRDRFDRTVAAAELCLRAGRADVALGLLDDADAAARAHGLDVWDPTAAGRALRSLHTCCLQLVGVAGSEARASALMERADDVFNRLARTDPGHAIRSTQPPS